MYIACMTLYDILYYIYCCMLINESIKNHSIECVRVYQHSVAKDGLSISLSHGMYHCMHALFHLYSIVSVVTLV